MSRKDELLALAERVEALTGRWKDAPATLACEVFSAAHLEPPRGPWYWRSSKWQEWGQIEWGIILTHKRGNWFHLLEWVYSGRMPEMVNTDPKKAIAAALRALAATEQ